MEEKILNLPKLRRSGESYLQVHPGFRAIFTSNPEEYAGIHKTQDALMDRLITIHTDHFDRDTEVRIVMAKSGIAQPDAAKIVDIVRELRGVGVNNHRPTIRACILIARMLVHCRGHAQLADPVFQWVCQDVLSADTAKVTRNGESLMPQMVDEVIRKVFGSPKHRRNGGRSPVKKKGWGMAIPRKGLREIRSLSGRQDRVHLPYQAYMQITCLEMEKARRGSERKSALQRIANLDARLK